MTVSSLKVKVVPGSSRTKIDGWLGESLKIRVRAKPEKGKANEAVIAVLADLLRIPKKNVCISSGLLSSNKTINIKDLSDDHIRSRLPGREA